LLDGSVTAFLGVLGSWGWAAWQPWGGPHAPRAPVWGPLVGQSPWAGAGLGGTGGSCGRREVAITKQGDLGAVASGQAPRSLNSMQVSEYFCLRTPQLS